MSDRLRPDEEAYVPGLALPEEPQVPGRHRRLWVTLALLGVLAVAAYVTLLVVTSGQSFDPALELDADRGEAATDEATPDPAGTVPGDG